MTEDEILNAKPYLDTTIDKRAAELADALMSAVMALPTVRTAIDALPEHTKQTLDHFLCSTAAKALEGKPLVDNPVRLDILGRPIQESPASSGQPLEPEPEGEVFQVQVGGLLLSQQTKRE